MAADVIENHVQPVCDLSLPKGNVFCFCLLVLLLCNQIHGKHIYVAKEKGELDGFLSKYSLVKPQHCKKCDINLVEIDLVDHMKTVSCRESELTNMIGKKQLSQLDMDYETQLVRTEGIPHEYHPTGFTIYVPDWVAQAIKAYDSMKSRGGFQDMTLTEYLNNMAEKAD